MTETVPSAEQYWKEYKEVPAHETRRELLNIVLRFADSYASLCVSAAVAQERERCAKIAENWAPLNDCSLDRFLGLAEAIRCPPRT